MNRVRIDAKWLGLLLVCGLSAGCLQPLDIFGVETHVTKHSKLAKDTKPKDDRIEDKSPVYHPNHFIVERFGHNEVTLNKSGSVTKLDVVPFENGQEKKTFDNKLFPDRSQALTALSGLAQADIIPSMEVVNGFMKPFNDGLYAAIEMDLQQGHTAGGLLSKIDFLHKLQTALLTRWENASGLKRISLESALVFVGAALLAGDNPVALPDTILDQAQARLDVFLLVPQFSYPIGFYTWNETLRKIFKQDRLLQNHGSRQDLEEFYQFAALALVLREEMELANQYQQIISLYAGLTNPYKSFTPFDLAPYLDSWEDLTQLESIRMRFIADHPALVPCPTAFFALVPASSTRDNDYLASRYCSTGVPPDVSLIDEIIEAIRNQALELQPAADSGWYDYQLWALETLLVPERGPESDYLLLTAGYKEKLIESFKSIITQTRETHVKQATGFMVETSAESPPIAIYPQFSVEPFPTFYLRSARAYRFLETFLASVLGEAYLTSAGRFYENNERSSDAIQTELHRLTKRLYGLYLASADSVGLLPETYLLENEMDEFPIMECRQAAIAWFNSWKDDPDITRDPRVITPVVMDDGKHNAVYWAVLGIRVIKIMAEFVEGFEPEIKDCHYCRIDRTEQHSYYLLIEQMEEVRIPDSVAPLTREEYRRICDQYDNAQSMRAALEALQ